MAFSPPVVGCLVKKGLQKGGSRAPQDPPKLRLGSNTSKLVKEKLDRASFFNPLLSVWICDETLSLVNNC